jgi:hypothetical protein
MRLGFIFSLPRAGSTYVQRVLSGAPGIVTTPEPWLMPALFGIRSGRAPIADFAYDHVRIGLADTLERLPEGEIAWDRAIAAMTESLYRAFCRDEGDLFLDKTPRNAVFAGEILQAFPEARILFLWRNPLAVTHSINQTWGGGRWKAYFYEYDLRVGMPAMVDAAQRFGAEERVMTIRYEDLVSAPDTHWPRVFAHFGVPHTPEAVTAPPKLISAMGDRTGQKKYAGTSAASVASWKAGFGNRLRRGWAQRYLGEFAADLRAMGYDPDAIAADLQPGPGHPSDIAYLGLARLYHLIELHALQGKLRDPAPRFARR